jgi:RNA polymerase sigma-70 factor (ECF subfamily)
MAVKIMLTDWEIAKGIIEKNPRIQRQVYNDFSSIGFGFLRKLGADEVTAQEISHESIITLFFTMPKLNPDNGKISTYFMSICRNKYFSHIKKSSKTKLVEDNHHFQSLTSEDVEKQDEQWRMRILKEEILMLLAKEKETNLKEDCRAFLNYQYGDKMSLADIAKIFNYTEKYAKKKAKNSRDYLRKLIIKAVNNRPELKDGFDWIN